MVKELVIKATTELKIPTRHEDQDKKNWEKMVDIITYARRRNSMETNNQIRRLVKENNYI